MNSMTGFGSGEAVCKGIKAVVEVSSVNRKQFETVVVLPRDYEALEGRIKDVVNQLVARGRVLVKVKYSIHKDDLVFKVRTNLKLAKAYYSGFRELAEALDLDSVPGLESIIRFPGVLQMEETETDLDEVWGVTLEALQGAMKGYQSMRSNEGQHLSKDLCARVSKMKKSMKSIRKRAPIVLKDYRIQLKKRIQSAGVDFNEADEDRILKEVVLFSDRCDITEELIRLDSHFNQFESSLKSKEPVGRKLDFLAQEIFREINTIGSKANDARISHLVVDFKTELEKFREQVQNVE